MIVCRALGKAVLLTAALTSGACGGNNGAGTSEEATPRSAETAAAVSATARTPSPEGAVVTFVTPRDGETVTNPVQVKFRVDGMDVVPAGTSAPDSGHHHVLIDTPLPNLDLPVPADAQHVHFGDGSSSTELTLPPGEHTLQLLFADHLHIPHEPAVYSRPITITVE